MPTRTAKTAWTGNAPGRFRTGGDDQLWGRHVRGVVSQASGRRRGRHDEPGGADRRRPLGALRDVIVQRGWPGGRHAPHARRQGRRQPWTRSGRWLPADRDCAHRVRRRRYGLDAAGFEAAAEAAKVGCPVSKVLTGVDITMNVTTSVTCEASTIEALQGARAALEGADRRGAWPRRRPARHSQRRCRCGACSARAVDLVDVLNRLREEGAL